MQAFAINFGFQTNFKFIVWHPGTNNHCYILKCIHVSCYLYNVKGFSWITWWDRERIRRMCIHLYYSIRVIGHRLAINCAIWGDSIKSWIWDSETGGVQWRGCEVIRAGLMASLWTFQKFWVSSQHPNFVGSFSWITRLVERSDIIWL